MIRVLQVVTKMDRGGMETMLINYHRCIDKSIIQFDYLVHRHGKGAYDDEIERLGGKIYRLPPVNPFSIKYRRELDSFFKMHPEYLIIHSHINTLSALILKYAKKNKVPIRISHSHISDNQNLSLKNIIKLLYRKYLPKYTTFQFACGEKAGKWLYGKTKYQVLPNAIDVKKYIYNDKVRKEIREELAINDNMFVVGHIGRFNEQKNHDFLVDTFFELTKSCPEAVLILVGQGSEIERIKEKVRSLQLDNKVMFLGVRSDIERILQAFDIFVMPSLFEGLPVTMVEAQAAGLKCIISDTISRECIMTNNVNVLPLSLGTYEWANKILAERYYQRENCYKYITDAGYDIENNAIFLTNFYVNQQNAIPMRMGI